MRHSVSFQPVPGDGHLGSHRVRQDDPGPPVRAGRPRQEHGCQMAIARFLDRMCLALRASGLWLRYAALQNLIPSFPWIAPPHPPPRHNPRKGRDQILPSGNLGQEQQVRQHRGDAAAEDRCAVCGDEGGARAGLGAGAAGRLQDRPRQEPRVQGHQAHVLHHWGSLERKFHATG